MYNNNSIILWSRAHSEHVLYRDNNAHHDVYVYYYIRPTLYTPQWGGGGDLVSKTWGTRADNRGCRPVMRRLNVTEVFFFSHFHTLNLNPHRLIGFRPRSDVE